MPTSPDLLDDDQYIELTLRLQLALEVVGLDHHYVDGLIDAVEHLVDLSPDTNWEDATDEEEMA